jgi:hypothetical protein
MVMASMILTDKPDKFPATDGVLDLTALLLLPLLSEVTQ